MASNSCKHSTKNILEEKNNVMTSMDKYEKGINYLMNLSIQTPDKNYPLYAEYPKNLMVEVTNACNLRCVMCYNRTMKRKKGFMNSHVYKLVLENAKEIGIEMVGLYTVGESLLHPRIFDFIGSAKEAGFRYVYITTNGLLLNKEKINKIFESSLDSIKLSIDAASKKTYEKLRPGGSFHVLYRNIKMLREMRDRKKSRLKIYASFLVTNKNYDELKRFRGLWKGLVDEVAITFVGNQSGLQTHEFDEFALSRLKSKMTRKEQYCNLLWNRIIVTYDGKFTICPEDFEAELLYGDIRKESLGQAWNNKKMRRFRSMFKTRNFNLSPRCETCNTDIDLSEVWEAL